VLHNYPQHIGLYYQQEMDFSQVLTTFNEHIHSVCLLRFPLQYSSLGLTIKKIMQVIEISSGFHAVKWKLYSRVWKEYKE